MYARTVTDRTKSAPTIAKLIDNFAASTVENSDLEPGYWKRITPANTTITESAGALHLDVGADPYNACSIRSKVDPRYDFFAKPIMLDISGVVFDAGASAIEPWKHRLIMAITSTDEGHWESPSAVKWSIAENKKFSLSFKTNNQNENPENVDMQVDPNGSGDLSGSWTQPPDQALLFLDASSYALYIASSAEEQWFAGEHNLDRAEWGGGFYLSVEAVFNDGQEMVGETAEFEVGAIEQNDLLAFDAFQNGRISSTGYADKFYQLSTNCDTDPDSSDGLTLTADGSGASQRVTIISPVSPVFSPLTSQIEERGDLTFSGSAAAGKQVYEFGWCSERKDFISAEDAILVQIRDNGNWAVYQKSGAPGTDPSTLTAVASGTSSAPTDYAFQHDETTWQLKINGSVPVGGSGSHGFRDSGDLAVTNPQYKFGTLGSRSEPGDAAFFHGAFRDENTANTAVVKLEHKRLVRQTDVVRAPKALGTLGDANNPGYHKLPRAQWKAAWGVIDGSKAPFYADPYGVLDSTAAVLQCEQFCRDHGYSAYFPEGRYKVTDTLSLYNRRRERTNATTYGTYYDGSISLRGDGKTKTIFFVPDNTPGFNDTNATNRKPVIETWAHKYNTDWSSAENDAMGNIIADIGIEVGYGNAGAIGIRSQGAQLCALRNVRVELLSGYTCVEGANTSGGSNYGVDCIGGKIGFDYADSLKPKYHQGNRAAGGGLAGPLLTRCTMSGQSDYAIKHQSGGTLVLVGSEIDVPATSLTKTAVRNPYGNGSWAAVKGNIIAVDSEVRFETYDANNKAFDMASSVVLINTHITRAGTSVAFDGSAVHASGAGSPTPLAGYNGVVNAYEYVSGVLENTWTGGAFNIQFQRPSFVDGVRQTAAIGNFAVNQPIPSDLYDIHTLTFPSINEPHINGLDYGLVGDGITDDTAALEAARAAALAADVPLFLPRGIFRNSAPLELQGDEVIFAMHGPYSRIACREAVAGVYDNDASPNPLIRTANSATAAPKLVDVGLHVPDHYEGGYCAEIRSGKAMVWDVYLEDRSDYGFGTPPGKPSYARRGVHLLRYSGQGGGWLSNFNQGSHWAHKAAYRHFYATGLRNRLNIYMFDPEHAKGDAQSEFNDCRNFHIYSMKTEGNYCSVWFSGACQDFNLYGLSGNWSSVPNADWDVSVWPVTWDNTTVSPTNPAPGDLDYSLYPAIVRIDAGCTNYRICQLQNSGQKGTTFQNNYGKTFDPTTWTVLWDDDKTESPADYVPFGERPVMYKRGTPP